jgi:hypothetical protein
MSKGQSKKGAAAVAAEAAAMEASVAMVEAVATAPQTPGRDGSVPANTMAAAQIGMPWQAQMEMMAELARLRQEIEGKQRAAAGAKGRKRQARGEEEEDEEEELVADETLDDELSEAMARKGGSAKKKRLSRPSLEELMSRTVGGKESEDGSLLTVEGVESFYRRFFRGRDSFTSVRMEAEARRWYILHWAAARYWEVAVEHGSERQAAMKLMQLLAGMASVTVRSLQEFEHDSGTAEGKVERLQDGIIRELSKHGASIRDMARREMAVPHADLERNARSGGGRGGRWQRGDKEKEEEAEDSGKGGKRGKDTADNSVMKQLSQFLAMQQQQQQPLMPPWAAMQQPPSVSPVQAAVAATMPVANQQFAPQGRCYICGQYGHRAMQCPVRSAAAASAGAASTASGGTVWNQYTPHNNMLSMHMHTMPTELGLPSVAHEMTMMSSPVWHAQSGSKWLTQNANAWSWCDDMSNRVPRPSEEREMRDEVEVQESTHSHEEQCTCGFCGQCTAGIDLAQKERRKSMMQAKDMRARAVEQKWQELYGTDERKPTAESYKLPETLREYAQWYESEKASGAWQLLAMQDEWETEAQMQEEKYKSAEGPSRSTIPLRELVGRPGCKKLFDKADPNKVCRFCKRKGHTIQSCMVCPRKEGPKKDETELQRRKREFVLGLCARPRKEKGWAELQTGEERKQALKRALEEGRLANEGNPWAQSEKRRDKLRRQLGYWWAIGADDTVIMWIGFGVRLRFETPPQRLFFPNHRSYWEHIEHVRKEHETHLADGSFRVLQPHEVAIGNPLQVEVNAKGKKRMCSDDRFPNAYLANYDFTQETLNRHVPLIVERGMLMITTDIEKAYYQVPLHKESQQYCAWRHEGSWIAPTIGIFGLGPMPFVFTKIMRPVIKFMRGLRVRGTNCIDDNLWAEFEANIDEVVEIVKELFAALGWNFNAKCVFRPSTTVLYNGMFIDSDRYEIRATDEKIEAARRLAWTIWFDARDGKAVKVKDMQRLAGRLQSMKLALEGVAVWTRGLYADIAKAQETSGGRVGESTRTHLREAALADVSFWAYRLGNQNGLPIADATSDVHVTLQCDASDVGWGAHTDVEGSGVKGELPAEVLGQSSTARELTGVLLAAESMEEELRGRRIVVRMDSHPAICNLIRGGGKVEELCELVRRWWLWCKRNHVTPTYEWIPREENDAADTLSKEAAATHRIRSGKEKEIREWLEEVGQPGLIPATWLRTRVQAPRFDKIAVRMQEMIRARRPACIVTPRWVSQAWWPAMLRHTTAYRRLGTVREVLEDADRATHEWIMEARILVVEQ